MPFDGDPKKYETKPEVKVINAMIERLSDPRNWTKKCPSFDTSGPHCLVSSAWGRFDSAVAGAVKAAIMELFPSRMKHHSAVTFNEHPDTTHADVLKVLYRAREILSSQSR